jgi:hypothetical protein
MTLYIILNILLYMFIIMVHSHWMLTHFNENLGGTQCLMRDNLMLSEW